MLKVVLTGLQLGLAQAEAHARLATLFKTTPEQVAALLSQRDHVLKAGLDEQTAEKYRRAIESAGGTCRVEPEFEASESLEVDLPTIAGNTAGIKPSTSAPAQETLVQAARVIGLDKAGHSKLEKFAGAAVAIALAVFGSAKVYEWATSGSSAASGRSAQTNAVTGGERSGYLVPATKVDAGELAKATDTRMPATMPIVAWQSQGFGFSQRTRIYFLTDTFGKITKVDVDQLGVRTTTGQVHPIPKFALKYHADSTQGGDILIFASFNGAGSPVRLYFDAAQEYTELAPNSGEYVTGKMGGNVGQGMRNAKTLKIVHGVSATGGELAFQYDLVELRKAIGVALAALGTTPTALPPSSGGSPVPAAGSTDVRSESGYRYGAVIEVRGKVVTRQGKTPDGASMAYPALVLDRAISVLANSDDPAESDVTSMHMIPPDNVDLRSFGDRAVVVTGEIFHSDNGNHMTKVLMHAKSIVRAQ